MRKLWGVILILGGIAGIFLPIVPGDVLILSGLMMISPEFAKIVKSFYSAHPTLIKVCVITSAICVWGVFLFGGKNVFTSR
jgi:hypothetical protein